MQSSNVGVDLKNPKNSKSRGKILYYYEPRKNSALQKSPLRTCMSSSEAMDSELEDPPKESLGVQPSEPSMWLDALSLEAQNSSGTSKDTGSIDWQSNLSKDKSSSSVLTAEQLSDAPKPETHNSSGASVDAGSIDWQTNLSKDKSPSSVLTAEQLSDAPKLETQNSSGTSVDDAGSSSVLASKRLSEAPKPEIQNSSEISMHDAGSIDLESNLAKEHSPSSVQVTELVEGQMSRRYPSRVRVSAVRNIPNGHGKAALSNGKKDRLKANKHSPSKNASEEKARNEAMESKTISEKIEKGVEDSTRKRKNEEEVDRENKAIKSNEKDHPMQNEAGENLRVDQRTSEQVVEGNTHSEGISDREKVKAILSLFETIYTKLMKEEKAKPKNSRQALRADLMAYRIFNEKSKETTIGRKYVGNVPGVEIGDEFNLRVELCVIGIHRQHRLCVDFTEQSGKTVAVSIVYSRPYADVRGNSNFLVYSNYFEDTQRDCGNLALKNSMGTQTPVRVIHSFEGYPSSNSRETKTIKKNVTYVYDGLYLVVKYWRKKDTNGQYASMFRLKKMPDQAALVKKVGSPSPKKSRESSSSSICIKDISLGKEKIPIRVVNTIDDEKPRPFKYVNQMVCPSHYSPPPPKGCDCSDGCSDSESCACAVKNGGESPFNCNGDIVEAKPLVYECGPSCKCPPSCHNRVSQHGIKFRLEVFKTDARGWGVRCRELIPTGSFVCEYIGELLDDEEAQKRTDDDYLFAIGNNYYDESLWEGLNTSIPALQKGASDEVEVGFAVDALEHGNVGRFVNHSCTPNLFAQNLLYDHDNKSMPHVVLFAQEDIPPLQELTYDYNYAIDQVHDSDGNIKTKKCYCGSIECTGKLY